MYFDNLSVNRKRENWKMYCYFFWLTQLHVVKHYDYLNFSDFDSKIIYFTPVVSL
jgi:hypothetical protein